MLCNGRIPTNTFIRPVFCQILWTYVKVYECKYVWMTLYEMSSLPFISYHISFLSETWCLFRNVSRQLDISVGKLAQALKVISVCFVSFSDVLSFSVCPQGRFGLNCSQVCTCSGDQYSCHHVTGKCSCLPGYYGNRCHLSKMHSANLYCLT